MRGYLQKVHASQRVCLEVQRLEVVQKAAGILPERAVRLRLAEQAVEAVQVRIAAGEPLDLNQQTLESHMLQ